MKRHTQKPGVRRWAGDDLIELQSESLRAIDSVFESYPACVVSGCEITSAGGGSSDIGSGVVSLKGVDHLGQAASMVVPFEGAAGVTLPIYLTLSFAAENRVYGDGALKPIAYNYAAAVSSVAPREEHLVISATGTPRFRDLAQKEALALASQAIETKVNKIAGKGLSDTNFTQVEKTKLDTVAESANNYVHPSDSNSLHMTQAEKTKLGTVAESANNYVHPSDSNSLHMTQVEKTKLGTVAENANYYAHPSDSNSQHMTQTEKSKLAGVANGANYYVHPNDINTRHVTDDEKNAWGNVLLAGHIDFNGNTIGKCKGSFIARPYSRGTFIVTHNLNRENIPIVSGASNMHASTNSIGLNSFLVICNYNGDELSRFTFVVFAV